MPVRARAPPTVDAVLILLPPSEGKTAPADGPAVELSALSHPSLTATRERVLDALVKVSARPDAGRLLKVGASLADEVARNTALRTEPTAPASQVYTGVLYAAAGLAGLTGSAADRAAAYVRVVSALWGLVGPRDLVPAYRLSMGADLPGVGPLAKAWQGPLGEVLDPAVDDSTLVVDCRSAAYLAAWRPREAAPGTWVQVRVEQEVEGRRKVVSHHAKHTRGLLTRQLVVREGEPPQDAPALAEAAREMVSDGTLLDVGLDVPPRGAATLTLVVG